MQEIKVINEGIIMHLDLTADEAEAIDTGLRAAMTVMPGGALRHIARDFAAVHYRLLQGTILAHGRGDVEAENIDALLAARDIMSKGLALMGHDIAALDRQAGDLAERVAAGNAEDPRGS